MIWWVLGQAELFHDVWSLDWDDAVAMLVAVTALVALFVTRKSRTRTLSEKVDEGVLIQFRELFDRLVRVETDLKAAKLTIDQLREEIGQMRKVEEFLEAKVHEREKQIASLKAALQSARNRIEHLEMVCRRAGINGDIVDADDDDCL